MLVRAGRVGWVDVAKAMAIVLVVLFHATQAAYGTGDQGRWEAVNSLFATFRMPLFFTVSGLFAARSLDRPWRWVLTHRVGLYLYLYVLWWLLREAGFELVARAAGTERDGPDPRLMLVHPSSAMWFLYALALFFLAARAMRRVPVPLQLLAAAALSAVAGSSLDIPAGRRNMALYLVFFLLGAHLSRPIRRWAQRADAPVAGLLVAAFVVATVAVAAAGLREVPPFRLALGLVAVAAGLALARVLDRTAARTPLAYLGRNTLPVYVLHSVVLAALVAALPEAVVSQPASPLPLTVAAVGISLALNLALRDVPGLLSLPGRPRTRAPRALT